MGELGLVSKLSDLHIYRPITAERPDIPNLLNRALDVQRSKRAWCDDITYIWTHGHRHDLAVRDAQVQKARKNDREPVREQASHFRPSGDAARSG